MLVNIWRLDKFWGVMYNVAKIKNNNSEKSPIVSVGENLKTSSSEVLNMYNVAKIMDNNSEMKYVNDL